MKGYKGFNKDLTCIDFKYEIGETYEIEEEPIICEKGFHFCKELEDVFNYYPFYKKNRFCIVEAYEDIITNGNKKYCTNKIKIVRELSLDEIIDIICIKDKETFTKYYNDDQFDKDQIRYIYRGLQEGLDISSYAKPEFNRDQMRNIYWGLQDALDVSIYAKPEFNEEQMKKIYLNLLKEKLIN